MARGLDFGKLEQWRRRLADFRSSGLTVAAFCRQASIAPARFYYWSRRVRECDQGGKTQQPRSSTGAQARRADACGGLPPVELFIGSQIRVRLPAGDPDLVASVISSVGASAANRSLQCGPAAFQRIDLIGATAATDR